MKQEPFKQGDLLRYISGDSIHFRRDEVYTCSGCSVNAAGFTVGIKEVAGGLAVWFSHIWELAVPETKACDVETYQIDEL